MIACLLKNDPASLRLLLSLTPGTEGGEVKASLKGAFLQLSKDPKPGELTLSRVNSDESRREARTRCRCNDMR